MDRAADGNVTRVLHSVGVGDDITHIRDAG